MEAVVYISHGSRSQEWNTQFIDFIHETFAERVEPIQAYGFFELAEPSIGEAISSVIQQGATKVTVVPVLLLSGNHGLIDIPTEIADAQAEYPDVPMFYAPVVGSDNKVVPAILEKVEQRGFYGSDGECILVVAHGSGHEETVQELTELSALVREAISGDALVEWGYLSRDPHYLPKLHRLLEMGGKHIYIVPHFLAKGGFTAKIERQLAEEFPSASERERIHLCEPTGYHSALQTILRERAKTPLTPVIKQH